MHIKVHRFNVFLLGNTCLNGKGEVVQNNTEHGVDMSGTDNWCNGCQERCLCPDWRTTPYNSSTAATTCGLTSCTLMLCPPEDKFNENAQDDEVKYV